MNRVKSRLNSFLALSANQRLFWITFVMLLAITVWMQRYTIEPGMREGGVYQLNRITGGLEHCYPSGCRDIKNNKVPEGKKRRSLDEIFGRALDDDQKREVLEKMLRDAPPEK